MMKVLDRILLFIYSLIAGIGGFFLIFAATRVIQSDDAQEFARDLSRVDELQAAVIAVGVIVILISVRFFYVSVRRSSTTPPSIDQRTDFGDIRISIDTIENLALKSATKNRGIKDLKARVNVSAAGLEISIRALVDGESSIPQLTEDVQRSVKEHVEEISGIPVAYVSVYVANIIQSAAYRARVE